MRKTLTTIRCVPRFGYENTQVRSIDVELNDVHDELEIGAVVTRWFATRGIADALYDVAVDDSGFFAIVNDEVYDQQWGEPLL